MGCSCVLPLSTQRPKRDRRARSELGSFRGGQLRPHRKRAGKSKCTRLIPRDRERSRLISSRAPRAQARPGARESRESGHIICGGTDRRSGRRKVFYRSRCNDQECIGRRELWNNAFDGGYGDNTASLSVCLRRGFPLGSIHNRLQANTLAALHIERRFGD